MAILNSVTLLLSLPDTLLSLPDTKVAKRLARGKDLCGQKG